VVRIFRRNISKRARRYSRADIFVVSIPKSGRTWLRVFLHAYFCALKKRKFTLDAKELFSRDDVPKFIFSHDVWGYLTARKLKDRISGKPLIPPLEARRKRILLLARDPRDVMVSLFFQLSKRTHRYAGDLPKMIRHPKFGIGRIVDVMNSWMKEWGDRDNFKLIRYEDCQSRPAEVFREVLRFFGCREIDEASLAHGVKFSSFENMKLLEATGQVKNKKLTPGNRQDPDSYKVRRGRVGAFQEYLAAEDIRYVDEAMKNLDRRYGYSTTTAPDSRAPRPGGVANQPAGVSEIPDEISRAQEDS